MKSWSMKRLDRRPDSANRHDEQALLSRAIRLWRQRCRYHGWIYCQPSKYSDVLDDGTVILSNCNGELARVKPPRKAVRA